jgi:hypothetical protein
VTADMKNKVRSVSDDWGPKECFFIRGQSNEATDRNTTNAGIG